MRRALGVARVEGYAACVVARLEHLLVPTAQHVGDWSIATHHISAEYSRRGVHVDWSGSVAYLTMGKEVGGGV
jgi:hypothetical protein